MVDKEKEIRMVVEKLLIRVAITSFVAIFLPVNMPLLLCFSICDILQQDNFKQFVENFSSLEGVNSWREILKNEQVINFASFLFASIFRLLVGNINSFVIFSALSCLLSKNTFEKSVEELILKISSLNIKEASDIKNILSIINKVDLQHLKIVGYIFLSNYPIIFFNAIKNLALFLLNTLLLMAIFFVFTLKKERGKSFLSIMTTIFSNLFSCAEDCISKLKEKLSNC